MENDILKDQPPKPVVINAGFMLDPTRVLDSAKDLSRTLQRAVGLILLVDGKQITYIIDNKDGVTGVIAVKIDSLEQDFPRSSVL